VVSSWLVKVILGIALVGIAVIELGSPLVAKAQLDGAAHEVADEAALLVRPTTTQSDIEERCEELAATRSVEIVSCTLNRDKTVVTVMARKEARSLILKNVGATEDWYDQTITVTADVK